MSVSSAMSSLGSRAVEAPLIRCPHCRTRVKFYLSNIDKHVGWVFYKCINGPSGFWHWELEYIVYLVDNHFLNGNEAVDPIGAAEDRREQLLREREERARLAGIGSGIYDKRPSCNPMTKQQADALLCLGREMLLVLKAMMRSVLVLCVRFGISLLKK
ncbi:hypothetical protein VPH35_032771 [Triticum aestivum]